MVLEIIWGVMEDFELRNGFGERIWGVTEDFQLWKGFR